MFAHVRRTRVEVSTSPFCWTNQPQRRLHRGERPRLKTLNRWFLTSAFINTSFIPLFKTRLSSLWLNFGVSKFVPLDLFFFHFDIAACTLSGVFMFFYFFLEGGRSCGCS